MHIFLAIFLGMLLLPGTAHAGPVFFAALSGGAGIGAAFGATALGSFMATTVGQLLTSVAFSALSRALQSSRSSQPPGIKTTATQSGGINHTQFILGRYATGGYADAPAMSHGAVGKTPNAYLTYVIDLSDVPTSALNGLIIDGALCEIGATPHADYGLPILGDFLDRAWVKFYSGNQTVADPMLLAKYGSYPERPWTADMVGTGISYAILTFRYDREVYDSLPAVRFVVDGIKLYDPRKDSTVGGSGAHRWAASSTWEFTQNPIVMIYNIMRGITLPDGNLWGGGFAQADLPLVNWFAAMNVCDVLETEGGASVARYRAGMEVAVSDEPADVIDELLKSCSGQIVDMGGTWKVRAGGPGLPVVLFSDEDVIATRPEDFEPFPALSETYNGITATYPEPGSLWEPKEAAPIYNAEWEAEDGERRLVASLQFKAVTSHRQVRNLMRSAIRDHRRMRRHNLTLAPFAMGIEPLDVVAWSSARNGYSAKEFEVGQVADNLGGLTVPQLALREVDPTDFDPDALDDAPLSVPPGRLVRPSAQTVQGWTVTAENVLDDTGIARRLGVRMIWSADGAEDARGLRWEIRIVGATAVQISGTHGEVTDATKLVSEALLPTQSYEARARYIMDRPSAWTGWTAVTTGDVRLGSEDMSSAFIAQIDKTAELAGVKIVSALPAAGEKLNQVVCLIPPGRLYRWTGLAWTQDLFAGIEPGSLTTAAFASGIRPVEIVAALPATGNFAGRVVFLTTDNKLYRYTGTAWTAGIPAADVTGQLTNAQIADIAAAKLTGTITAPQISDGAVTDAKIAGMAASKVTGQLTNAQIADVAAAKLTGSITSTQISDGAVLTAKLAAGAVVADKIAAGAITTAKIAAGAVSATEIGAGAITTAKLAAGAVTATEIAAGAVTAGKIAAGAVTAAEIAAGAITTAKLAAGAVTANEIAANAVVAGKIAAGVVTATEIAAGAITTAKLAAGAVTANEIAANAVVAGKIAAGAVTVAEIAAGAITTVKLAAGAVTANEIAANAVVAGKIAAGVVTATEIAAGAITTAKLAAGAVTATEIAVGAVTAGKIAAGAIGTDQLAARAVVASKIAVSDFTNLLPNSEFNNLDGWYSYTGTVTQYRGEFGVGLRLEKPAGVTAEVGVRESGWPAGYMTPVVPGERLRLKCKVRRIAGVSGGNCGLYARLVYADGTTLGTSVNSVTGTTALDTTVEVGGEYTVPAGVVGLTWQIYYGSNASSAGGVVLITDISIRRMAGGELIVDGAITGYHIQTNSLDASVIGAGKLTAEFLDINQMVTITSDEAGFAFGKTSPGDFSTDGMFMGKSLTSGGASGFGFLLGKTSPGGFDQSIQHTTEGGLKITNANFQFNAGTSANSQVTTSQTVTLPVGTKTIDLSIVGGGGGGGESGVTYTGQGGTTTVQLWNGSTNTGISWTAQGGLHGGSASKAGENSANGIGGSGAYWVGSPSNGQFYASPAATGNGAGGGGGSSNGGSSIGKGGKAGATTTVTSYDVSGLANPKLVITIGAGGSTGVSYSSAGTGGIVKITTSAIVSVPANVVPLKPTASGSFTKAANATGSLVFPDLGAGLWILNTSASGLLYLDQVKISSDDKRIRATNARSVTFVADIRPNITVGNANAATIEYVFYSMKVVT